MQLSIHYSFSARSFIACTELICLAMQQLEGVHAVNGVQAPGHDAMHGQDADGSSDHEESFEELIHFHINKKL